MNIRTIEKRVDNIETNLTPKEWAIRLADEMRKYPSEYELHYSILNYSSEKETPFRKPFFALNKRAEEQHPGHKPEDIRLQHQTARKLRGGYQALKTLLLQTNEKIKHKMEIWKLKASLQLSILNALILLDIIAIAEVTIDGNDNAAHIPELGFPSMVNDWRPDASVLIVEFYLYDSVVKTIQDKYLDGHPFIYRDVEAILLETEALIEKMTVMFNEYLQKMAGRIKTAGDENETGPTSELFKRFAIDIEQLKNRYDQKSIIAVAEAWAKNAKDKAIVEFLEETGRREEADNFLWKLAKEEIRSRHEAYKELDSIPMVTE